MKKKATTVELLTQASNDAIGVVKNMLDTLKKTNDLVASEKVANEERIAKIQSDNATLDKLKMSNEKIISNFEAMLG